MSHKVWVALLGLTLSGCKATTDPAPTVAAPSAPTAAVQSAVPAAPEDVARLLPALSGSLPEVPDGALRITVRRESVEVGQTAVAELRAGKLPDDQASALARALTIAGSASRPVAIYVDASLAASVVLAVMDAARASGASAVGLVARMESGEPGWLGVRGTTLKEDDVPVIRIEVGDDDFEAIANDSWSKANGTHRLSVSVDGSLDSQAMFTALHTLRGPRCADEPGSCRFAALGITDDPLPRGADGRMLLPAQEGTIGLGNVGLIGKGGGGGSGSGYGRGAGQGKRVPRVRQGSATVGPALDKDIIRRIVRAHINEVRHCYNQGLVKDPDLGGEVKVDFTIDATGKVAKSSVKSTTLSDAKVGTCIARAVKRWKFPKPQGGAKVSVSYPFILAAG